MANSRSTKRALISSALATLTCAAMLVGSTFAWFTDTASTAVNKIQSGILDVDIKNESGDSLDGERLYFRNVAGETDILWEPGATFQLDSFKLVNDGNLALKYKVIINGVDGNAKLLEAIDFTVKKGDSEAVKLEDWNGVLLPEGAAAVDGADVMETALITISGHMKEDAGNDYQNLNIEGIGITVVAAQYTYEKDIEDETYDENATYPVSSSAELSDKLNAAEAGSTVVIASGKYALPGDSVSGGIIISGAGSDRTVLTTNSKNYTFTGENLTIKDVTVDGTALSSFDHNGAIKITGSNAVLDNVKLIGGGQNTYGHTARVDVKADTVTTIKNSTISGAFRGIQSFSLNGTLLIENSTLAPQCYCLNVDAGTGKIVVNNSTLMGWTSYTDSVESATFTDCTFEVNPNSYGYNCVRAYTATTFVNCDFGDEFWFGAADNAVTVTFENCRYKGTPITESNVSDILEPDDNANTTVVVK